MPCKNPKEELQNLSQQNPTKKHRRKAQRRYKDKQYCLVCWGWEQQNPTKNDRRKESKSSRHPQSNNRKYGEQRGKKEIR
jgi:hypothetical protein